MRQTSGRHTHSYKLLTYTRVTIRRKTAGECLRTPKTSASATNRMSTNTAEGLESSLTTKESTVTEAIESFVEVTTDALDECGAPEETLATVEEQGKAMATLVDETIEQQSETLEETTETIDGLEAGREESAKDRAKIKQRVTSLEEAGADDSDSVNPTPQAGKTTIQKPETPLEQVSALPQDMIDEESANVQRAVFVAQGVRDYSRKVPAGRAIKSSELRKVLKAGTDCHGHTETVSRVMNILDDMGGEDIQLIERRGEKRIVFSETATNRLEELTQQKRENHGVVIEERV